MAYKISSNTVIDNFNAGSFANVTFASGANLTITSIDTFQGTVAGYAASGDNPGTEQFIIDKYSFASSANATDVGRLSSPARASFGQSSTISGYASGGGVSTQIQKFPFATDTNAVLLNSRLVEGKRFGASHSSSLSAYCAGGFPNTNTIQKFSFSIDTNNATDVGDLSNIFTSAAPAQSSTTAYVQAGYTNPPLVYHNTVEKYPFSTDTNASVISGLKLGRNVSGAGGGMGVSSTTHGYNYGGGSTNTIEKFPFSTESGMSDVGDLDVARNDAVGTSYTTHGYVHSGVSTPAVSAVIIRFPFSTDTNASSVGNLSYARNATSSQQD